ncbi:MAG: hypothetical protein NXI16_04745 [Alphaproteobacteria bacterium]|nr:hypothetical protein [Alphaproteobacteria bacterium]
MADVPTIHILKRPRRIWAVAAIHGEAERLGALHDALAQQAREGDRLCYLGNMIGHGAQARETIEELLDFRTRFIGRSGMFACDVAYLRGQQEEMWHKLLQLQFAPDPPSVLDFMIKNGLEPVIRSYGGMVEEGRSVASQGPVAIAKWTSGLRAAFRSAPGHAKLMGQVRRVAADDSEKVLFVSAGIDPTKPIEKQGDRLWWGGKTFDEIANPYERFMKIVRGYDPDRHGFQETEYTLTIDDGCGFGGPLIAVALTPGGEVDARLEI